jgi:hypothetical protein
VVLGVLVVGVLGLFLVLELIEEFELAVVAVFVIVFVLG